MVYVDASIVGLPGVEDIGVTSFLKRLQPHKFDIVELHNLTLTIRSWTESLSLRFVEKPKNGTTKVTFCGHNGRRYHEDVRSGDWVTVVVDFLRLIVETLDNINVFDIRSSWFPLDSLHELNLSKTDNLTIHQPYRHNLKQTDYITLVTDSIYIHCSNLRKFQLIVWNAGTIHLEELRIPQIDVLEYLQALENGTFRENIRLVRLGFEKGSIINIDKMLAELYFGCDLYGFAHSLDALKFVLFEKEGRSRVADVYLTPTSLTISILEKEDFYTNVSNMRFRKAIKQYDLRKTAAKKNNKF